jgi:NADH dehydrogenase [ubiquinone] 1 alpha subcomplex assembly factor 7
VSPLEQLIRERIAAAGALSVADYMALCLGHPEHGYYATRDPLGARGDFVTAPEISQLFGEMIGGWIAAVWDGLGRPEAVLAEFGPGRGTLMADALRVAHRLPGFRDRVRLFLVETSPVLRRRQAATLAAHAPSWITSPEALPEAPLLVLANEFFDALPIRQFLRLAQGWQEREVRLEAGRLAFGWGSLRASPDLEARFPDLPEGRIVEICEAGEAVAAEIGRRIARQGGAALVIDYGDWDGTGDTLQAVAAHGFADPLAAPGEADLTAHLRFRALAEASRLKAWGPVAQGIFLERLGITARARALAARAEGPALEALVAGHRRLTHPDEMGHLFKVMALTPPGVACPPGFAE